MGSKTGRLLKSSVLRLAATLGLLVGVYACLADALTISAADPSVADEHLDVRSTRSVTLTWLDYPLRNSDGSAVASQDQAQALSNPITLNSIAIDEEREGWEQAEHYQPADPALDNGGVGKVDWITVTLAHDCSYMYVRYVMSDGPSIATDGARYNLLVDVDANRNTGYWGSRRSFSIGADVLVQGTMVFAFTGGANQEAWSWSEIQGYSVDERSLADSGRDIEYKISISDLDVFGDSVTGFNWIAWADHTWGDDPIDLDDCDFYPDGGNDGEAGDFYTYAFNYPPPISLFPNPERGLFRQTNTHDPYGDKSLAAYQLLSTHPGTSTLQCHRDFDGITLVHRNFWLAEYVDSTIPQTYLDNMQADFDTIRAAGMKMIVRFAYTPEYEHPIADDCDASKEWMLTHTEELSDVLRANSDVIAAVQAGFIGGWGEWSGSCHFDCDADWEDCGEVLFAVLDMLPSDRMVQVRTPRYKQRIFDTSLPVSPSVAHSGTDFSRTGHHNDCFVSSASDYRTYLEPLAEYPYLISDTTYVAIGGETCDPSYAGDPALDRRRCVTATRELEQFHWSFLSTDWFSPTLQLWRDEGCFPDIEQRLGYRFVFSDVTFPEQVTAGQNLEFGLQIMNEGYAAPYNPRATNLVLSPTSGAGDAHVFTVYSPTVPADQSRDPRFWLPGETRTVSYTISIPLSLTVGTYQLLLELPDPELPQRPEYSIRLVGCEWEPSTGQNRLNRSVSVTVTGRVYLPVVLKAE